MDNLPEYEDELELIGDALSEEGDVLLYGCNVGAGAAGEGFITSLAEYTGADVAAWRLEADFLPETVFLRFLARHYAHIERPSKECFRNEIQLRLRAGGLVQVLEGVPPRYTAGIDVPANGATANDRTAADIVVEPTSEIRAPVTGTVIRGGGYDTVVLQQGTDVEFDNVTVWCGTYGIRAAGTQKLKFHRSALYGNVAPWTFRSDGSKRDQLCKTKLHGSQQLLAAILNSGLNNGAPVPAGLIEQMLTALQGTDRQAITSLAGQLAAYNESGDNVAIVDNDGATIPHADPRGTRSIMDVDFADCQ